jgi:nucleotidyltransferase-like protein
MNDDKLNKLVERARKAAGENLQSVILFGSAASGDYEPGFSDLNVLCVLRDASPHALSSLSDVAKWWAKQKQPPPLLMTHAELERTTDVFTIELLDMQQHHRVLFGEDVIQALQVPLDLHRVQVEYELREKIVLLRQEYLLAAGRDRAVWELMLHSAPSFITLFRHALIALGQPATAGRREAVEALGKLLGFDASVMLSLLDVRQKKSKRDAFDTRDLFARYVAAIETVTDAVDKAGPARR